MSILFTCVIQNYEVTRLESRFLFKLIISKNEISLLIQIILLCLFTSDKFYLKDVTLWVNQRQETSLAEMFSLCGWLLCLAYQWVWLLPCVPLHRNNNSWYFLCQDFISQALDHDRFYKTTLHTSGKLSSVRDYRNMHYIEVQKNSCFISAQSQQLVFS